MYSPGAVPGCLVRVAKCLDAASPVLKKVAQWGVGDSDTLFLTGEKVVAKFS